jgi:putative oxidoreductase
MIKKLLFSTNSSSTMTAVGILLLRLMFGGGMLIGHGWVKLSAFGDLKGVFSDPLGIGSVASLCGAVFAEVICAALVTVGLFTRATLIPLIFTMGVAAFIHHAEDPFFSKGASKELALVYLVSYIVLFLTGPGKYSIDKKLL